jgi:enoyl-CoA hydratase
MMGAKTPVSHMSYKNIVFDVADDGIATLTMNRPAKLNALNAETMGELDNVIGRFESEAGIKALIVTGAGEKAFVAGADIAELAETDTVRAATLSSRGQRILRRLELVPKPSVAAINGFALGGGLELAMACTMRVASSSAKLGQPEVKLGIVAGYGATQRLPRLVGRGKAMEMLLTADIIDAAEAHRIGLVNHVVDLPELLSFCKSLLARVLANGPVAISLTMQAIDIGMNSGLEEGLRFEAAAFGLTAATDDRMEGTRAFLEKRAAVFTGR